ncbi:NAD(P)/FAD-dependent oxidoreductase [Luteimonas viscosa]|uniref:NAD(P)/FAD-dependent oxidoreductase n=1 Tax=Luteimonas viscosa TaxID=1132694 RepID=A0A5D4XSJ8_9GAMM|nr:NAD(P)/FAD-dependent oxidoreductase [Luteimonas viscosa]TYT27054.1 NAD(P)/FAD-dependent oxidoreductase [Luteimonas viscosa]
MIDVAIVGGGPAGLTAATYLRRFHRSCVVLDAGESRARWIPESNNCPGFPGGVSGTELLRLLREQAREFEVPVEPVRVERVARDRDGFVVQGGGRSWHARVVMIATGLRDRLPAAWAEDALACGALRLCPICDAFEASDRRIGVYGPADSVGSHAGFLLAFSSSVFALPADGGDGGAAGEAARQAGVQWLGAGELQFDGRRCSYKAVDGEVALDTVYSYLGFETSVPLDGLDIERTRSGEIVVDRHQQTHVPGLYAIGDIVGGLNQIAVAVGQAAIAATHVHGELAPAARGDAESAR